jgi:elongator complex protein 4
VGGGIPVGGLVMVMEDIEAPHHMPLLRFFMAQGLVHSQPLFFATPLPSPQAFLGTLPAIASRSSGAASDNSKEGDLRIAWQYRRFLNEQQALEERRYRQQELASKSWSPASPSLPLSISGTCGDSILDLLLHCSRFVSNLSVLTFWFKDKIVCLLCLILILPFGN